MDDEISSREGGTPEQLKSVRRRRSRKLSGPAAHAMGELAFALYVVAASEMRDVDKWKLLQAKLLAWRGAYLP